jgi:hypothetical protein
MLVGSAQLNVSPLSCIYEVRRASCDEKYIQPSFRPYPFCPSVRPPVFDLVSKPETFSDLYRFSIEVEVSH